MTDFFDDPDAPIQPDQFAAEFSALLDIFDKLKPQRILEIGVREGGTLYQWIKHAEPGAQIVAVDLPGVAWGHNGSENTALWSEWAAAKGVNLTVFLGDSHDPKIIGQVIEYTPFDFVFIDGDHSLFGVAADFLAYGYNGVIALHDIVPDITDDRIEGWKFWNVLRYSRRYKTQELLSDEQQTSRGIGVVYVR